MSRLGGGRSITDRVIFRQDTPPVVTDSVVWIDTTGEQPQAKIYNPGADEWLSVGVVDYNNLVNTPAIPTEAVESGSIDVGWTEVSEGDEDVGFIDGLKNTADFDRGYSFTTTDGELSGELSADETLNIDVTFLLSVETNQIGDVQVNLLDNYPHIHELED